MTVSISIRTHGIILMSSLFVRHKAHSYEEFLFAIKQTMEAEDHGEIISRTILDEWGNSIGIH